MKSELTIILIIPSMNLPLDLFHYQLLPVIFARIFTATSVSSSLIRFNSEFSVTASVGSGSSRICDEKNNNVQIRNTMAIV